MNKPNKSQVTVINLEETVSHEVLAKLYYLCRERKLKFPEGVLILIKEVSEPDLAAKPKRAEKRTGSSAGRKAALSCKGKVR